MDTAKIFESGNSQAIRLPKAYRFDTNVKELVVRRCGDMLTLIPKEKAWENFMKTPPVSDDFLADRNEGISDEIRENLFDSSEEDR